jgi:hypothetical protein
MSAGVLVLRKQPSILVMKSPIFALCERLGMGDSYRLRAIEQETNFS